ncbi:MAG: chemotaxis protein CheA [Stenotrophobium sp.]
MTTEIDQEILSDFIVEAGELIEKLGEQLVELEQRPDDSQLLNAVFRAFHTVKGGAGFLQFTNMVTLCHAAEDVFNGLRNGKIKLDGALMDAVMQAVDQVQAMMAQASSGTVTAAAPAELIERLHAFASAQPAPVVEVVKVAAAVAAPATSAGDAISDDEFEALLDSLHGTGKGPGATTPEPPAEAKPAAVAPTVAASAPAAPVPVPAKPAAPADTSIRVDTQRLDRMMNLVGEMVLVRNRLKTLTAVAVDEELAKTIRQVDFITRSLQDAVMQIRMLPIRKVFSRFPKVARDVARSLGKQVEVELIGEDTDLDKNLVEALGDPLIHMVRNAVDHGIEMPEQRQRCGKPVAGKVVLAACQQGDHIVITVSDDGAGMDAERLRNKVVEKGLMDAAAAARLSNSECFQLVFMPGFSTKEQISDLSGRGVGMDVVKSAITQLNGSVKVDSVLGQGSRVEIRVPLTLAILPALMVAVADRVYALPLASVVDVTVLDGAAIRKLDAWDVVLLRKEIVRLVYLDRWAGVTPVDDELRHVALIRIGDEQFGFVVDQVIGREEVVIKPLGTMLRGLSGLSGATVTGAGRVALILDCASMVRAHGHSS